MGPRLRGDAQRGSAIKMRSHHERRHLQHRPARISQEVGITSQREIEKAVRDALADGRLKGHEKLAR